ncbi:MAG: N-acetylglucosamine-6-phosphate deacetylase [Planctomycetota bacterium]
MDEPTTNGGASAPRSTLAFVAARVRTHRSEGLLTDHAVLVDGDRISAVVPRDEVPAHATVHDLGRVDLAPGFVDVQVNGGGGVLLNEEPSPDTIRTIVAAHRRFGTTSLLPTLITDTNETMWEARRAVDAAIQRRVPGVVGAHFEGPFLDPRKAGAHDRGLVRGPHREDLDAILEGTLGVTLVTAAACCLDHDTVERLLDSGARVSLGHCASTYAEARAAFAAGVTGVTHLYTAMSQLESRAPGLVGAALATGGVTSGLIVDGVHVDYGAVRAAWRACGTDGIMLVTDAVQPVGSDLTEFRLGGQRVRLVGDRCVNEEGNLAGSALDMASAVRNAVRYAGIPLADALRMASSTPARFLGLDAEIGGIAPGMRADLVVLDDRLEVVATVAGGAFEAY